MIEDNKRPIRRWLVFFMIALILSGVTAMPVVTELELLVAHFPFEGSIKGFFAGILAGVKDTQTKYPYLFYGYDWLAFAHIVLAILFIGPYRDPVKNIWVIEFGIIACILIIPFALIAGHFRDIPLWWRLIDCSFGVFGIIPLVIVHRRIKMIEKEPAPIPWLDYSPGL